MPSAILYPFLDGEDLTAEGIARRAMHTFVGGVMNEPIWTEDREEEVEHYEQEVAKAEEELRAAEAMTLNDAFIQADLNHHKRLQDASEIVARQAAERSNLERLQKTFEAWRVPLVLEPVRNAILLEIQQTLDRHFTDEQIDKWYRFPCQTPQEWIDQSIKDARQSVEFYKDRLAKAQERRATVNDWLDAYHSVINDLETL